MSWHLSNRLIQDYANSRSLLEPEAESLVAFSWDGEPSAPWNSMPSAPDDSCSAKMKATSHRSPFGMMYLPLTDALGAALLTWFQADSRAKTSQPLEPITTSTGNSTDSMDRKVDCGGTCHAWFAKWNQATCSWRTPHCSLFEELTPSLETWPRWGLMRDGECSIALNSEQIMRGKGFSSLLPTPTAHNAKEGAYPAELTRNTPTLAAQIGGKINPDWNEWRMGWPLKWTGLEPLETARFQVWRDSHGRR